MAGPTRPGTGSTSAADTRASELRRRLQAARARVEVGFASALSSALSAAGLRIAVQSTPAPADRPPPRPPLAPTAPPPPVGEARPFPAAEFTSAPRPLRIGLAAAADDPGSPRPVAPSAASFVFPKVPVPVKPSTRAPAPPKPPVVGPSQMQVMTAVQNAVVGAVKVVSGTIAGVTAARDAAVAAGKTAGGMATVASGMATVASGFFPQLAALGIGMPKAPKAPKNRPGLPPQRRVADIIANPMGKSPPPGSPGAGGAAGPTKRVQRVPMVRAKSSLDLSRKEKTRKRRSYDDLQSTPRIGLTPHEVLLKVATLALGKTLLGMLEAGARGQQKALRKASDRMSEKQVLLLGMLPAQYIVQRLPQQPQLPAAPSADSAPEQAERPAATKSGGPFKIRY